MIAIRGDRRVADIYFTEFNRIFYHYYFRSVQERTKDILSGEEKKLSDQQTLWRPKCPIYTYIYLITREPQLV